MKEYNIHSDIIHIVSEIYQGDTTISQIGDLEVEMQVTSGIKQECTCSTILFKLVTYVIIKEMNKSNYFFKNDFLRLGTLFYADDGLLLSNTQRGAEEGVEVLTRVAARFGLVINKARDKSIAMVFNMKEHPENVCGITIEKQIKYLGITLENKTCLECIVQKF